MKKKFLTVYDYGMGAVWYFFLADSKAEINEKYPRLEVLNSIPVFIKEEMMKITPIWDIDDEPNEFLKGMMRKDK